MGGWYSGSRRGRRGSSVAGRTWPLGLEDGQLLGCRVQAPAGGTAPRLQGAAAGNALSTPTASLPWNLSILPLLTPSAISAAQGGTEMPRVDGGHTGWGRAQPLTSYFPLIKTWQTSLLVQQLRWLIPEDPTGCAASKPVCCEH